MYLESQLEKRCQQIKLFRKEWQTDYQSQVGTVTLISYRYGRYLAESSEFPC
jgi:hypothetical protein